jgi:uroporphyrinogen-III synthase
VTRPILAIRAEPGCGATVAAGAAAGLAIEACPLAEIRAAPWTMPPGEFDGLLLGSGNALRAGGPLVGNLVDKPVYAVGEATAAVARERGFSIAGIGPGRLQALLDGLSGRSLRLLRLAGREHVPVSPPPGATIETAIVYESIGLPLPRSAADVLRRAARVQRHSAAAARHYAAECERLEGPRSGVRLAALGPRIARAAGTGWGALRSAAEPNEAALLALAREMCHDPASG